MSPLPPNSASNPTIDNTTLISLSRNERKKIAQWLGVRRLNIAHSWYQSQFNEELLRRYGVVEALEQDRDWIVKNFLLPLIDLLIEYARTGEDRYKALYLDERLRYAPHLRARSVKAEFFDQVLPADEAAIMKGVSPKSGRGRAIEQFLIEVHAPLRAFDQGDPVRLLALGDCLMNEIRAFLPSRSQAAGIQLDMRVLYFSAPMGRSLSTDQVVRHIESEPADLISFSFLTYEGLPTYPMLLREANSMSLADVDKQIMGIVQMIRGFLTDLRDRTDAPFLVHNASGLPLERLRKYFRLCSPISPARARVLRTLNDSIRELVEHIPRALLIDETSSALEHGYRQCSRSVIPRRIYSRALFHPSRFGEFLSEVYDDVLRSFRDLRKAKLLLVDFDNTLWEGVMADGPVRHHRERQEVLNRLKQSGILLAAVSRNDPQNVRWDEILLKPDDFVLLKIGWNPKVESIQTIAQQLDLDPDSFVLIDDSPVERELVRTHLPKVKVMDSGDPYTWRSLGRMLAFPNARQTEESRARTAMYRAQAQRREATSTSFDYAAAMKSLQLVAAFGRASQRDLARISELIQRTNQFNTTTIRYTESQLRDFLKSPAHRIYVAELSDKFGRQGLVAVAIIRRQDGEAIFDSFVMSCRAMGFELERLMLTLVMGAESDSTSFKGRFIATDRNTPAASLFLDAGFEKRNETEWVLRADAPRPQKPDWFEVNHRESRA